MTHSGNYYGIPVYLGNLEFTGVEPVMVAIKYKALTPLFNLVAFLEWLFTPPNAGSLFWIDGPLEGAEIIEDK